MVRLHQTKSIIRLLLIYAFVLIPLSVLSKENPTDSSVVEKFALYYKCDSIDINENYLSNKSQIEHIRHYLRNSPRIDSITIYSWASPEGGYEYNKWLSQERGKTARRFLLENCPDSLKLNEGKIHLSPLAENWSGLLELVEKNYFRHDRDKVIKILKTEGIKNETRKWRLQQLDKGLTWRYLVDTYMPDLRTATWICVWVEVVPLPSPKVYKDSLVTRYTTNLAEPEFYHIKSTPVQKTILGLKTNLLYDAVSTVNYAIEVPINEHFSLQYEQNTPWWLSKDNRNCLQFLTLGGEFRWWFAPSPKCETECRKQRDALMGHFLGINGWGGYADIQYGREFGCYQFDFWSAGLTYGYAMPVGKYLNLEFSISAGYARIPYQHYIPTDDWQILIRDKNDAGTLHYFGPTKAEISLVIPIRATIRKGGR